MATFRAGEERPTASASTYIGSNSRTPPNNDLQTLLCLKAHLSDTAGKLASWKNDSLQFCSWAGVRCSQRRTSRVVALDLGSFELHGQIPACIANLTFLARIHFPNNQLSGPIPRELGQLNRLQYLNLSSNHLSGAIPDTLSSCSRLQIIDLGGNSLQGVIPPNLSQCLNLEELILQHNSLNGGIPEGLGMLQNLSVLHLAGNSLMGKVPLSLGCKSSLTAVVLTNNRDTNNSLTGPIPSCLANSWSLQVLDLTNNHLDGEIPYALLNSRSLKIISLGLNKFVRSIPAFSHTDSPLEHLILSSNYLSGAIPSSLGNLSSLIRLLLAYNNLEGSIPMSIGNIPNLQALDLTYNYLSGTVPTSLYNMSTLTYLGIGTNNLEGEIPNNIGFTLPSIKKIFFLENQFHGMNQLEAGDWSFLSSLANCTRLVKLSLSENKIQGTLPSSIGGLGSSLKVLLLAGNNISGTIPPEIGHLTNVTVLYLGKNQFIGSLPNTLGNLSRLVGLSLPQNKLSGQIPVSISNLSQLNELYLQENDFSGPIPKALGYCKNLEMLNLSWNSLDGRIPKKLLTLSSLSIGMDLSHNQLSGQIPLEIGGLINLGLLNMSNNQLSGQIPSTLGQCKKKHTAKILKVLGLSALSLLLLSCLAVILLKKKKVKREAQPSFKELKKLSYADIVKATNGFSSSKLVGSGKSGSVYRARFEFEEHTVAVKVFKLDQLGAPKSFLAECEALRNTRHRNLVRVITACSTFDASGHQFKALILEYMPNGSLESWLYPTKLNNYGLKSPLSLGSRITIAVDIASAFDYLHNHCMPAVAHCDLKPSNVLLDDDMGARLADFGLAKFLHSFSHSCHQSSTSLLGPRGSIGYIAPEYGFGSKLSTEGDVYSYGIIILEMLTGKRPTDEMFTDGLNLHKFVEQAFPQKLTEVLDPCIVLSSEDGDVPNNLDHENNATDGVKSCIGQLVKLGLSCSMETPKDRPTMQDVYAEVITIKEAFAALHG
ncbi:hypothetical protein PVAP13_4NG177111 [Panicum virgatum]|uniref:Receptor kinase-like protein Xa21 n=1 Tax=Panicum virgatum TaxID=38727 RepID=A0A8T0T9E2_PANVG|nr:hypothetical protein PVAP13_4NG177111 [Panicum virgatum]